MLQHIETFYNFAMERKIIYFGDYFKDFIESLNTEHLQSVFNF